MKNTITLISFLILMVMISSCKKTANNNTIDSGNGSWNYILTYGGSNTVEQENGSFVFLTNKKGYIITSAKPNTNYIDLNWSLNTNRLILNYTDWFAYRISDTIDITFLNADQFTGTFTSGNNYHNWTFTRR